MTLVVGPAHAGTAQVPLFMLASATECCSSASAPTVWRTALGNFAAGATAGCAVELGEGWCWHRLLGVQTAETGICICVPWDTRRLPHHT